MKIHRLIRPIKILLLLAGALSLSACAELAGSSLSFDRSGDPVIIIRPTK